MPLQRGKPSQSQQASGSKQHHLRFPWKIRTNTDPASVRSGKSTQQILATGRRCRCPSTSLTRATAAAREPTLLEWTLPSVTRRRHARRMASATGWSSAPRSWSSWQPSAASGDDVDDERRPKQLRPLRLPADMAIPVSQRRHSGTSPCCCCCCCCRSLGFCTSRCNEADFLAAAAVRYCMLGQRQTTSGRRALPSPQAPTATTKANNAHSPHTHAPRADDLSPACV